MFTKILRPLSSSLRIIGASAPRYFVSSSGNDANDGRSPSTPWQTVTKVNATPFSSNTWVLFKKGDSFPGMLIPPSSYLSFDAYGSGSRPVINGSGLAHALTIYSTSTHHLSFRNLIFSGSSGSGNETVRYFSHDLLMEDCDISNSAAYNTCVNGTASAVLYYGNSFTGATIKNNLFIQDIAVVGANKFPIYSSGSRDYTPVPANNPIDYNEYYYNGIASYDVAANGSYTIHHNWAAWRALTGTPDSNGTLLTALPGFVTRYSDLHPAAGVNLVGLGTPLPSVTTVDKDGNSRSSSTPTPGCFEGTP